MGKPSKTYPVDRYLPVEIYKLAQELDLKLDGDIGVCFNYSGRANWTVCPECLVDDFVHIEGCSLMPKES